MEAEIVFSSGDDLTHIEIPWTRLSPCSAVRLSHSDPRCSLGYALLITVNIEELRPELKNYSEFPTCSLCALERWRLRLPCKRIRITRHIDL